MSRILSTLAGISRFQSGVGAGDDLKVRIREDAEGRWFPALHRGHFYIGTEGGYLYAKPATWTQVQGVSGSRYTFTAPLSGVWPNPTESGPVRLTASSRTRPLTRVISSLRPFRRVIPEGTGDIRTINLAASGLLVSLVTDPVTGILYSVAATGDILGNEDYVYNPRTGQLHLPANHPAFLWGTFVVGEAAQTLADLLRQEEILQVDPDGKVRTQLGPILSGAAFVPLVRKPGAAGMVTCQATAVSGNAITFSGSGQVGSGDIVAVQYWVANSFVALVSGGTLACTYLPVCSGTFTLSWETGRSPWYDTSLLASGTADWCQLNPLVTPRESGFLYLADVDEPWPLPARFRFSLSSRNPLWSPSGSAALNLLVTALDAEGDAVPNQLLTATLTAWTTGVTASGTLTALYPATAITDGKGQVLFRYTPAGPGRFSVALSASGVVTGKVDFCVQAQSTFDDLTEQRLGKLLLHLEQAPYREGLYRLNAAYVYPDGAPYQAPDVSQEWLTAVTFSAGRSRFYTVDGQPYEAQAVVSTDLDGIASVLVAPQAGDWLRASVQCVTSGRTRAARPVVIPAGEQDNAGEH